MPGHLTLADLDRVIQAAMGWTNSHMHMSAIDGRLYGVPDDEWLDDKPVLPDEEFTLDDVLGTAAKGFLHDYDVGDGWHHDMVLQAVETADEQRNSWPMCLAGANACPPEDVGGLGGYADFLQVISDPSHEQHDTMWRCCGRAVRPEGLRHQFRQPRNPRLVTRGTLNQVRQARGQDVQG